MAHGFFEVSFPRDLSKPDDFAFKWHGHSVERGRGGAYGLRAATAAWHSMSAAAGMLNAPVPKFISAKHRVIRPGNSMLGSYWLIDLDQFSPDWHNNLTSGCPSSDNSKFYDFLLRNLDCSCDNLIPATMETQWNVIVSDGFEEKNLIKLNHKIYTHTNIRCTYWNNFIKNSVSSLMIEEFFGRINLEVGCIRSYLFSDTTHSATLKAAMLGRRRQVGSQLAMHFRSRGNEKYAGLLERAAARSA